MSVAAGLRVAPLDAAASGLDRVLAGLRAALIRYVDARSRAAAIRELERLSDETLRDIGLRREEIRDVVARAELPWS
ncbi:MAG: DUF1127 domain-containing protein [Betaproteobacteria bacterium]|nr:DUF1127 domain-containing protein [Betaproteobacteria bacterium]MDH5220303.1 DUF1127 domain-containing protein [Betaproteobacteria bacterium]MDH5350996.1 DUF1127 domain-containing protein [Betaproteobacteria bacterium]